MRQARETDLRRLVILADAMRAAQEAVDTDLNFDSELLQKLETTQYEYDAYRKRFYL